VTRTHVALIRGINVGKAKRVAMPDLKKLVESLGFTEVRTLLNSGNVVFTSSGTSAADAAARIEEGLAKKIKVPARVTVLGAKDMATVVRENSLSSAATNPSRLLVAVYFDPKDGRRLLPLVENEWGGERLVVGARAAYMWCPEGVLASKLQVAVGKLLRDGTTVRNWSTIQKLQELLTTDLAPGA